jgi:hypothetical protein
LLGYDDNTLYSGGKDGLIKSWDVSKNSLNEKSKIADMGT